MRNADNDAWISIGTFNQTTDSFTPEGVTSDKIEEGNSSVEVVDSGSGYVSIVVDGAEAMHIDNSGDIGFGTPTPDRRMHISSSAVGAIKVTSGSSTDAFLQLETTANEAFIGIDESTNRLKINNAGTLGGEEHLSIDTTGMIRFNSGFGSAGHAYGCRAWVNFDGTGTPSIRDDGNVSSITDNGEGRFGINFSSSMPDGNFAVMGASRGTYNGSTSLCIMADAGYALTAVRTNIIVKRGNSSSSADSEAVFVAVFR
jgi:hypothetical protein